MNEHTKKLLEECSSGCKMGVNSMNQVQEFIQDGELQKLITRYKKKHEDIEADLTKALEDAKNINDKPGAMASAFSWFSTEMKLMIKGDNRQIAKLMMDGCNMGIQSIGQYVNEYTEASREARGLAETLIKMEEEFMKELKAFL